MYGNTFGNAIEGLIVISVIFVALALAGGWFLSGVTSDFDHSDSQEKLEKCESNLKRDEHCELIAVPIQKNL